jgi:light-regulated signal transduction histidine kinase (bacteriophytochrome)
MLQVWINLIDNAVKYSSKVNRPRIVVRGREEADRTVFEVIDNGVGFDSRYAGALFGVFQRLHGALEYPGTGVGLAIVQRIVTRHGGEVWAKAEVNQGATFGFALPKSAKSETSRAPDAPTRHAAGGLVTGCKSC